MILPYIKYLLFCYGFTAIFMYGAIMEPIRNLITWNFLQRLTSCAMCLGFWVGIFSTFYFFPLSPDMQVYFSSLDNLMFFSWFHQAYWLEWIERVVYAVGSSGITWLLCAVTMSALWNKVILEEEYASNNTDCKDTTIIGFSKDTKEKEVELHG